MDFSRPVTAVVPTLEGRVLIVLARASQALSGSRVADLVPGASNPGVRRALERLVKQGVVTAQPSSNAILYTANREHLAWEAIEVVVEFATNVDTALRNRVAHVVDQELAEGDQTRTTVALYGSVARGTSDESSDVDLVVLAPDDADRDAVERLVLALTVKVPTWTGNPCSVYDLSHSRLRELIEIGDPIVPSWQNDAITLNGPNLHDHLTRSHA